MPIFSDFPRPSTFEFSRSQQLFDVIRQIIDEQKGVISFATFMDLALYHPQLGYYQADNFSLGKSGDFTTAPEISPLFAKCFASQILQVFEHLGNIDLLEIGAGTGQFAKELLLTLQSLDCLPQHYYIYEISHSLRKQQQALLQNACPDFYTRIQWLDHLPDSLKGVIIANEVLDALPVHCFKIDEDEVKERGVSYQDDQFIWQICKPTQEILNEQVSFLKKEFSLSSGYESEINLNLSPFIQSLAKLLKQGLILLIDYGYGRAEYYHPARRQGTLTCFYKHHNHHQPLIQPGLQDITAHVDFTTVIECCADYISLNGYTSQAGFLLSCGLMDWLKKMEKNISSLEQVQLYQAIKLLTLPQEMGERVKVMGLTKDLDISLLGFQLDDRRRDL